MEIPSGYGQANVLYLGPGVEGYAEVTLGLDVSGFPGTATEAAEAVWQAYGDENMLDSLSSSWSLEGCRVKFGPQATGPSGEYFFSLAGQAASDAAVANLAALVTKNTAFGGRAGRGRCYMPGIVETQVSVAGMLSGGLITSLQDGFDLILSGLTTLQLDPVLLHGADSPIGSPTPITSFSVQAKAATQRRRLRR